MAPRAARPVTTWSGSAQAEAVRPRATNGALCIATASVMPAATKTATAAARARRRKSSWSAMSRASTVRYTAARKAKRVSVSAPTAKQKGVSHGAMNPPKKSVPSVRGTAPDAPPVERHRAVLAVMRPERESRAAQHDANEHEGQRDVQRGAQFGERRRETREEQYDNENQPDMVRLPDWPDCLCDEGSLRGAPRSEGKEIPDTPAEVGSAQKDIGVERDHDQSGQHVGKCKEVDHPSSRGRAPTGISSSAFVGLLSTCRYSSQATMAPRKQYSTVKVRKGMTSPGIGVTASAVRRTPWITQGCLPTSVTTQPASVQMNPIGAAATSARRSKR